MSSLTEPATVQPRSVAQPRSAPEWLDALAAGACDQETFVRGVGDLLERAPDAGWELLALIDQYYRRGKINAAAFTGLKTHLQNILMGQTGSGEISVPLKHTRTPAIPSGASAAFIPTTRPVAAPAPALAPVPAPAPAPVIAAAPVSTAAAKPPAAAPTGVSDDGHAERSLVAGDVLRDRYRVVSLLGQGGMGSVFEAIDLYRLDRENGEQRVAIKVLHTAVIQRPRLFAELRREFQHLQSLSHPNIVRVHEFDRDGSLAFFTMEYLSGVLLSRVVAAHLPSAVPRSYAFAIVRDVGAAVVHAHARGVVHGDLNPGNIFITDRGEVRVLDFGAAHQLRRTPWISDFESSEQITVATPRFASCQLLEGETADARDDVYALACIAYYLLTGNHPYRDHSALKARTLRLKPSRPGGLNRRQWSALSAGLAFARDRRPLDMAAWLEDLISPAAVAHLPELPVLLSVRPPERTGTRWLASAMLVVLVAAGVWWAAHDVDHWRKSGAAAVARIRDAWERGHGIGAAAADGARLPAPASEPPMMSPPHNDETIDRRVTTSAGKDETARLPVPPPATSPPRVQQEAMRAAPVTSAAPHATAVPPPVARGPADNPLPARVELAADSIDVSPGEDVAHVVVRRTRSLQGDVDFKWWTESGTAKPGRDYAPVKMEAEYIKDGKNAAILDIPIMRDPGPHDPRSFYIVIDEPSDNAALGRRTLTMVTLPGTE